MTKQNLKIILQKYLFTILVFLMLIFLSVNIFSSQDISPLYAGIIGGQKQAAIDYLRKIKLLPEFKSELENYKETFGTIIENEVFQVDRERKEKIGELEQLLTKNNQARDVLYGLYLLNKEDGNNNKAQDYLNRAREIDPML